MSTMSGARSPADSTATSPSPASPTMLTSCSAASNMAMPERTKGSSSTTNTRITLPPLVARGSGLAEGLRGGGRQPPAARGRQRLPRSRRGYWATVTQALPFESTGWSVYITPPLEFVYL